MSYLPIIFPICCNS
uniref:Uncharacterized protein n=1 Tax=Arundo donax TaxID=35708 RepID=A0A0A9CCN0_ARUDO